MKRLGKIKSAVFGMGGYQDAMLGVTFVLGGEDWGCGDFWGAFYKDVNTNFGKLGLRLWELLRAAKKESIADLADVPIELEFDDGERLISWRVLTEVV